MSDLPLISICIPAYNHEKYMAECIQAAINHTYPNKAKFAIGIKKVL